MVLPPPTVSQERLGRPFLVSFLIGDDVAPFITHFVPLTCCASLRFLLYDTHSSTSYLTVNVVGRMLVGYGANNEHNLGEHANFLHLTDMIEPHIVHVSEACSYH